LMLPCYAASAEYPQAVRVYSVPVGNGRSKALTAGLTRRQSL
jgi:hypothetical protein